MSGKVVKFEITVPKELPFDQNKVHVDLHLQPHQYNFNITWLDIFSRYSPNIFKFLESYPGIYAIQGSRNKAAAFMLDTPIRDLVNSYKTVLTVYKVRMTKNPNISNVSGRSAVVVSDDLRQGQQQSGRSSQGAAGAGNGAGVFAAPSVSVSRPPATRRTNSTSNRINVQAASVDAGATPPNTEASATQGGSNTIWPSIQDYDADANSMFGSSVMRGDVDSASLATNDRNEIQDGKLKVDFVSRIVRNMDSLGILRMKQEMQATIDSRKWSGFYRRHPYTSGFISATLGLSFDKSKTQQ